MGIYQDPRRQPFHSRQNQVTVDGGSSQNLALKRQGEVWHITGTGGTITVAEPTGPCQELFGVKVGAGTVVVDFVNNISGSNHNITLDAADEAFHVISVEDSLGAGTFHWVLIATTGTAGT